MRILVVGHRNPDTDSIVSAIALAELLKRMGMDAEARRAGDLQPETRIVLEKTRLPVPQYLADVRTRARDIMTSDVLYVKRGEPIKKAVDLIVSRGIRSVPVVDEYMRVVGLFSTESFARSFMNELYAMRLTLTCTPLKNFVEVSGGIVLAESPTGFIEGRVFVVAMSMDSVEKRLNELRGGIVVVGDRVDAISRLIDSGVSAIIVTGGYIPPQDVIEKARSKGVALVSSPHDTYTTLRLLDLSQPVEKFAEEAVTVSEHTHVDELRHHMLRGVRTLVVVDDEGRLKGIVTRSDLVKGYRKRVALVDHNEFSQSIEGVEEAEIVAVVDHHRVSGDVKTTKPILFRIEPLGSTATIIWRIAREMGIELPKPVVEAMIYALLSDTLMLKGPTTTDIDRSAFSEMCRYVGISQNDAFEFMRIAMAANEPTNPVDVVTRDLKVFEHRGIRFGIAQILTANPSTYLSMIDRIREVMKSVANEKRLEALMLMITDYIEQTSYVLAVGKVELFEKALRIDLSKGIAELKGVTSRKSQVLPKILSYLETL